jgi:hypothetical protein
MKPLALRWAWACTMAAGLFAAALPLRAEDDGPTGAALLPEDVLVFLSVPSVPEFKERMDQSLSGELIKDSEFKPFVDELKELIEKGTASLKDEIGVTLDDLLAVPQGEITFAVVELPPRKLAMVLLIDYGDSEETVDKLLARMEEELKEAGGDVEGEEFDEANIRTFTFEQEGDNPFNKLAYFDHNHYVAFASDPDALKAVLDRWGGEEEETFANHEIYSYILEKCRSGDREPMMTWYINPIGLTQSAVSLMQAQVPQAGLVLGFLPVLGLDKFKAMGGAADSGVDEYDSITKAFFYIDQPTSGVLNVFQFPATDLAPPQWVPADASSYLAANWNVTGAYFAIENLVDSFQGPGAFSKLIDQAADNEDGPQIHIKKDIIDQLTGQVHMVLTEHGDLENPTPKMMFALDVKSAEKITALLAKAAKSDGFPGTTREFEGVTVYDIANPTGQGGASIAVADKHLMIATDSALLENALRPESDTEPLSADAAYQQVAKKFPKKISILGYQNGSSQLKTIYEMLKSGNLPGDIPDEARELIDKLPDFEALEKYLRSSGSYYVPDEKGALGVSFTLKDQD